jgi:probable O-glycosylation ligase (exosortase A-associated)
VGSAAPAARATSATPELPGGEFFFNAYLLLLVIEYLGLGQLFPPLATSRFPTLLSYFIFATIVSRLGSRVFREFTQNRLLIAFVLFTGFSILYAYVKMFAFTALRSHFDYFSLFVATAYLLDRPSRVYKFAAVWGFIAAVLVGRNVDRLMSAARIGIYRGSYFVGDGNDFAWLMCQLLPFGLLLLFTARKWYGRLWGLGSTICCLLAIVGTQSRGATLALAASGLYFYARIVKRKALAAGGLAALLAVALALAPSYYLERISTITTYEQDESATSRLMVWSAATRMALGDPLGVGAGCFSAAYGMRYRPESTNLSWAPDRWLSAHSVYFRALGEYGFLGLGLLLAAVFVNFRQNGRTRLLLQSKLPGAVPVTWPSFGNMSLIGYAVAGTFLGGLTYPHLYVLSGFAVAVRRMAEHDAAATNAGVPEVAAPVPPPPRGASRTEQPGGIRVPAPRIRPAP